MTYSPRQRAWRNTLIVATNAAFERGLFSPGRKEPVPGHSFPFEFRTDFDGEVPGLAHVASSDGSEF